MEHTKIMLAVLSIFVIGMTLGVAFAEPVDAKTFKSHGWKYKVSDKKWSKMKKQAKKQFKKNKKNRPYASAYSHTHVKVTLHKKGHKPFKSILYCYCNNYGVMPYLSSAPWK